MYGYWLVLFLMSLSVSKIIPLLLAYAFAWPLNCWLIIMGFGMATSSAALSIFMTMFTPTVLSQSLIQTKRFSEPFSICRSKVWVTPLKPS